MKRLASERTEIWRMRVELPALDGRPHAWPPGIEVRSYEPPYARPLHDLLVRGYQRGGGSVARFDEWLPATVGDAEWDPALCFLATYGGVLAGVALCWTSAFVKDIVVDGQWRRRGLGEALLRQVLETFTLKGATAVDLKVHATNKGAVRLYERIGMRVVERLPPT
jgi:ribosomal protein S18 acetylase RimI-like enzyme